MVATTSGQQCRIQGDWVKVGCSNLNGLAGNISAETSLGCRPSLKKGRLVSFPQAAAAPPSHWCPLFRRCTCSCCRRDPPPSPSLLQWSLQWLPLSSLFASIPPPRVAAPPKDVTARNAWLDNPRCPLGPIGHGTWLMPAGGREGGGRKSLPWRCNEPVPSSTMSTTTRSVAAATVAAAVIASPPRLQSPPRMLPHLLPLQSAIRAHPSSRQCRGGGPLLVKSARDTEHAVGRSGERGNMGVNAYCGGNAFFASKINGGPARLGEDYGSIQKHYGSLRRH